MIAERPLRNRITINTLEIITMTKTLLPFLFIVSLLIGCSNPTGMTESSGTITGVDYRKCASPCCGGYFIEIDGVDGTYRALSFPEGSDLDLSNENFPIRVRMEWSKDVSGLICSESVIVVKTIERE